MRLLLGFWKNHSIIVPFYILSVHIKILNQVLKIEKLGRIRSERKDINLELLILI
jgi:hypothetical protein